jgi:hypothetical protein
VPTTDEQQTIIVGGHAVLPLSREFRLSPPYGFPVSSEASFKVGQIVYTPLIALAKLQRTCEASGELYGIVCAGIDFCSLFVLNRRTIGI